LSPVPTFIERKQIEVVETGTINRLDAFTAPRLVEYYDPDPCLRYDDRMTSPTKRASRTVTQSGYFDCDA
jgi:hypothetical protein